VIEAPTNYRIFEEILRKTNSYKSGDMVLVNWVDFRKNDLVEQKNNKAITKSFYDELNFDLTDEYKFYKHQYQKHYYKESFLLFNLVITYFETILHDNIQIYFLYDTKRNFLIPPTFDLTYQLTHNIKKSSFLDFLIEGKHIDFEKNIIKSSSIEYISQYIGNLINGYSHVYSKSIDNSLFPRDRIVIDKYTTTDHSNQVDNPPT
jgi:hypothetical protein